MKWSVVDASCGHVWPPPSPYKGFTRERSPDVLVLGSCCWVIIKMMKARHLYCCSSRSLPHAQRHGPSVDFPQGCFLLFFHHRFFAMLIFTPVGDSCDTIWCLMPAADWIHHSHPLFLPPFLPWLPFSGCFFSQISFGIAVCLRTIKSCTTEIWKRALRPKCPTTLYRRNVSSNWHYWWSLPATVTQYVCTFTCMSLCSLMVYIAPKYSVISTDCWL